MARSIDGKARGMHTATVHDRCDNFSDGFVGCARWSECGFSAPTYYARASRLLGLHVDPDNGLVLPKELRPLEVAAPQPGTARVTNPLQSSLDTRDDESVIVSLMPHKHLPPPCYLNPQRTVLPGRCRACPPMVCRMRLCGGTITCCRAMTCCGHSSTVFVDILRAVRTVR
jgi:hypothetical protein